MLGLGFLGLFLFFFGIGAVLGLIYALIKGFPVIIGMIVNIFDVIKEFIKINVEGITGVMQGCKEGWQEAKEDNEAWLEKKGWK